VLGPVYIAELAPAKLRGRLVGMFQINIVIGILLAYLSNYIIASFGLGRRKSGVGKLGIAAIPAVYFLDSAVWNSAQFALAGDAEAR